MYEAFFGLTDSPFRLTPDPRFLYLSAKHAEALAHLRLGLSEPGGFVCITGDIGTGKTTVLRTFLADLGPEVATAYVFNPTLSWEDLIARIARELGVTVSGTRHVDLMDDLNAHLLAQRKEGRIAVVVIDEAQAIPLDVLERLRLLSNLETSTEKLLRLVLVGQPQLAQLLLDPALAQLNQRITLRWHLGPLTRAETFGYIRHRLTVAGGEKAIPLFTTPALLLVHRVSRGVPRLVNMVAHRAALAAFVRRRRRITMGSVRRAYREIRAVPLRTTSPGWRVGFATAVLAVGVGLATFGIPGVDWQLDWRAQNPTPATSPAEAAPAAAVSAPREPAPPLAAPASDADLEFERRLALLKPQASLRASVDAVLAAWRVAGLRADEEPVPATLEPIAHRRGLEDLHLTGNLSMLRLLDIPAVLELRLPRAKEPCYVTLTRVDDEQVTLMIGDEKIQVEPAILDRVWFGDSHVLWRDFEALGPTFGVEARGEPVARLQRLLARAGIYGRPVTGTFDDATQAAVIGFQRSRRLDPDCRVGRLTRIALYAAAGGYQIPTFAAAPRGRTVDPGRVAGRGAS
ncbi:MAG: AAA family ATPase [Candidatus Binatia bacterium]